MITTPSTKSDQDQGFVCVQTVFLLLARLGAEIDH